MKPAIMKPVRAKKPRAKPVDREGPEQAALMEEIALRYPDVFELIYHVPNGGHRHKKVAEKLKDQGVKAGIPDLVLPMARGGSSACTSNSRRRLTRRPSLPVNRRVSGA